MQHEIHFIISSQWTSADKLMHSCPLALNLIFRSSVPRTTTTSPAGNVGCTCPTPAQWRQTPWTWNSLFRHCSSLEVGGSQAPGATRHCLCWKWAIVAPVDGVRPQPLRTLEKTIMKENNGLGVWLSILCFSGESISLEHSLLVVPMAQK